VPQALLGSLDLSEREAQQMRRLLGKVLEHLDAHLDAGQARVTNQAAG